MWELDCEESWVPKNWCFWTVVLEKTLASPLDCKEIQPVHSKGDQSWVFFGRTDAEAETPILWPPDAKSWLIWEDSDAGRDWGQEEKGTTEDEMAGWHPQSMDMSLSELRELVMDREAWHAVIHEVTNNWTQLSHWTELNWTFLDPGGGYKILILWQVKCTCFLCACMHAQSCLTVCNSMDCSPPGFSVHGDSLSKNTGVGCHFLFQGIFSTWGLNRVSCITGGFFTAWAIRELSYIIVNNKNV